MMSVVCVYNSESILQDVLLKSLRNQTVDFETVLLDNADGRFKSAAEALNYGGAKSKGDYIVFAHQDMWLSSGSWVDDAERILRTIPDLGVAGVVGVSEEGKNWYEKRKFSIEMFDEAFHVELRPVTKPEIVQTLDECLLIVPREVFAKLQFDSQTFDGWDSYGADYCLSAARMDLKSYVIPVPCGHSCLRRRGYRLWEFKNLLKYQKRLYKKHKRNHRIIYTWMETVSWSTLTFHELLQVVGPVMLRLFPDFDAILARELSVDGSILDLGCGYHSPIDSSHAPRSVGVEISRRQLEESKRKGIHDEYILGDITKLEFRPRTFDGAVAINVLQYLTKGEGTKVLGQMQHWARKKVVVITPNGNSLLRDAGSSLPHGNESTWTTRELRHLGFRVNGLGGWKALRSEGGTIRYRPLLLWAWIADMTERITWYCPRLAFQLLATKRIDDSQT
jgi:SAM-dependent methyltransferase